MCLGSNAIAAALSTEGDEHSQLLLTDSTVDNHREPNKDMQANCNNTTEHTSPAEYRNPENYCTDAAKPTTPIVNDCEHSQLPLTDYRRVMADVHDEDMVADLSTEKCTSPSERLEERYDTPSVLTIVDDRDSFVGTMESKGHKTGCQRNTMKNDRTHSK